jgi:peptide/nickel transport system permease protein
LRAGSTDDSAPFAPRRGKLALTLAFTFLGPLLVTFLIGRVPIDPVLAAAGDRAPPDVYERMRIGLGLHLPLW